MRAAYKPPVPNSFASLSLELEKYDACKDIYKGTVIAEDGSMGFLFSNNELLNALNESTELFVDGTFSIVPRKPNIIQLYTIHIRYMNTGIATIFVLCESRTKALYRAIWEKIIELAPALQNNVKFIMGDYEKAAIATLSEFFPVAAIHGCWFHFNQSILRKWRQLKLTNAPKTLISMAMSVPLVPHIKFEEAFAILQRTADNMCDDHPAVLQFMSYMRNTWQNISEKVSVYNCPVRTNNLVESFHNQASKHFGKHTSLWIFIDNLNKLIITQTIDLGRARNNLQVRRVHSKINKERNDVILQRQKDLRQNRISLTEFLKSFHQFNENQQYLIDLTSSTVTHEIYADEICADLLTGLPIVDHDEELDENRNLSNSSRNTRRRSRRTIRTSLLSENVGSVESGSEGHHNCEISGTSTPERVSPARVTEYSPEHSLNDVAENVFNVPEDDYGYWYEDVTNVVNNSLPYFPVQQSSLNSGDREGNERPEGTCVICLDLKANRLIIPCGHMCVCAACADVFTADTCNDDKKCPICKEQVQNIIRVIVP
ncbi:uncharacterized protein [Temnothorax longispinosus]|uniref:uncharacterized protein n=1 Tax=Temnothorax longispinosus TaxID=300112 RepID=UPI003A994EDD